MKKLPKPEKAAADRALISHVFQKICTEEKLRYFMIGGTMLGAIRHKRLHPWDDDVDFGMPREDYDRPITLLTDGKRLPENYGFNYKTSADYLRYFSRIVDKRVLVYNDSGNEEITEQAWIDIFPLDGMPNIPYLLPPLYGPHGHAHAFTRPAF